MSRFPSQVLTLRRLARVYRRMLALAVPAALAACQGAADSLAPDAAGDPAAPAAAPAAEEAVPSSGLLGALVSNRIAFTSYTADGGSDIWSMDPQGGTPARLTSFYGLKLDPSWSYDHKHVAFAQVVPIFPSAWGMNPSIRPPSMSREASRAAWGPPKFLSAAS